MDSLPLVSVENEGILSGVLECCLSTSYSWIPTARGEDQDHSRNSLTACPWGVGTEGLKMEMSTCQVCWGKSQDMALGMGDSDTITTHSYE